MVTDVCLCEQVFKGEPHPSIELFFIKEVTRKKRIIESLREIWY